VSIAVRLVIVTMLPVVVVLLPESPPHIGLKPYGAVASEPVEARDENPFGVAISGLRRTSPMDSSTRI
jgi:hypothetical protein